MACLKKSKLIASYSSRKEPNENNIPMKGENEVVEIRSLERMGRTKNRLKDERHRS